MTKLLEFLKTSQNDLVLWCQLLQMVVMRAGFEVCNRHIVLFCSTYMTSMAVPASLVLVPKHTVGCKASDIYG